MAKTSCIKILEENITQNTSEASETSIKTYVSGLSSTTAAVFLLNFFPSETSQQSKPNRTNKKRGNFVSICLKMHIMKLMGFFL